MNMVLSWSPELEEFTKQIIKHTPWNKPNPDRITYIVDDSDKSTQKGIDQLVSQVPAILGSENPYLGITKTKYTIVEGTPALAYDCSKDYEAVFIHTTKFLTFEHKVEFFQLRKGFCGSLHHMLLTTPELKPYYYGSHSNNSEDILYCFAKEGWFLFVPIATVLIHK